MSRVYQIDNVEKHQIIKIGTQLNNNHKLIMLGGRAPRPLAMPVSIISSIGRTSLMETEWRILDS